jgi:regulator of protease activity HflC (stomatin/prohibitin superfamily)
VRNLDLQTRRAEPWAGAAERQRLLAEALAEGEAARASLEEITKAQRVVFILHREELTGTLEAFTGEKDCLVNVVPGKGDYDGSRGIEGPRGS